MTGSSASTRHPDSPWTPDRNQWSELLAGQPAYRVRQVWEGLYRRGLSPHELTTLPAPLRRELAGLVAPSLDLATEQRDPDGKTVKWLWTMPDGAGIETVLMHYPPSRTAAADGSGGPATGDPGQVGRSTVCVSSQAGCAMGCGFCATGQAGYDRNLTVGEILEQVVAARAAASPHRLSNVVFMGMGEPFANYDRVLVALRRIIDDLGIGARHITVSTIGLVPGMRRFAQEGLQVGLALSLHAANDELRSELVPMNRRHPIAELIEASRHFRETTGRRVSFEWAMIDGVNDRPGDADELAVLARRARAHVNLIPLNPTPGWPTTGSPPDRIAGFARRLAQSGVNVTVRANRGTSIDAACGQLQASQRSDRERGRATVPVALRSRRTTPGPDSAG